MTPSALDLATRALGLATAGFAVAALARPGALSRAGSHPGQTYYARMYAARALPLAAATVAAPGRPGARAVLTAAAAAQFGDVVIGLSRRDPGQSVPTLLAGCVFAAGAVAGRR